MLIDSDKLQEINNYKLQGESGLGFVMSPKKSEPNINFNFNFENVQTFMVPNVENFEMNQSNYSIVESVVFEGGKSPFGNRKRTEDYSNHAQKTDETPKKIHEKISGNQIHQLTASGIFTQKNNVSLKNLCDYN